LSFNPPFTTCWYDSLISRATECALVSVVRETSIDQWILNDVWFHSSTSGRFRAKPSSGNNADTLFARHRFAAFDRL
jgi:hypothetical protein